MFEGRGAIRPVMSPSAKPIIGLPACRSEERAMPFHRIGDKYVRAVAEGAGGLPLVIPAIGADALGVDALLAAVDGLFITGSPSNVEPQLYGGPASRPGTKHDPARDATTLPLIRRAVETGVPLLAVCRGIQELNVALGGTLHQNLQEVPGRFDHRSKPDEPQEKRYAPIHKVALVPGGVLAGLAGATEATVNPLPAQAIDRLAPGLAIEATAEDGTIEAVRAVAGPGFAIGVQWHPEWRFRESPFAVALLAAFGAAARAWRARRAAPARAAE
jgi:putative glutamine amidotransferase